MNINQLPTEDLIDMLGARKEQDAEEYSAYRVEDFTDEDIKNLIELNHLSIELYRRQIKF